MAFEIDFSKRGRKNLKGFRKRDQQIIIDAITAKLTHEPDKPTRQRKKLEDNKLAPWELRVSDFRVFYDIHREENLVVILAIGEKIHNLLYIDEEEFEL